MRALDRRPERARRRVLDPQPPAAGPQQREEHRDRQRVLQRRRAAVVSIRSRRRLRGLGARLQDRAQHGLGHLALARDGDDAARALLVQ